MVVSVFPGVNDNTGRSDMLLLLRSALSSTPSGSKTGPSIRNPRSPDEPVTASTLSDARDSNVLLVQIDLLRSGPYIVSSWREFLNEHPEKPSNARSWVYPKIFGDPLLLMVSYCKEIIPLKTPQSTPSSAVNSGEVDMSRACVPFMNRKAPVSMV